MSQVSAWHMHQRGGQRKKHARRQNRKWRGWEGNGLGPFKLIFQTSGWENHLGTTIAKSLKIKDQTQPMF